MLGIFHDSPLLPRSSPKGLRADLEWWIGKLRQPVISRTIPQPVSLHDARAFSDASSEFGIAIVIGNKWRAWRLILGWWTMEGQRDIGWAEAIAFECLVRYLTNCKTQEQHFIVYRDNRGVVEGWWNGRSRNRVINKVFKRLHIFSEQNKSKGSFHTAYVRSKFNPADKPSRGIYPPESPSPSASTTSSRTRPLHHQFAITLHSNRTPITQGPSVLQSSRKMSQ